jgi:hypothetical protein
MPRFAQTWRSAPLPDSLPTGACPLFPPLRLLLVIPILALLSAPLRGSEISLKISNFPANASVSAFSGDTVVKAIAAADGFLFRDLAPGAYNVEIAAPGIDLIGIDLRPRDASGNPVAVSPLAPDAEAAVRDVFAHTTDFFDRRRMPLLAGAGDAIVALVENVRLGDTTTLDAAKGQVLFRLDLWDIRKSYGSWRKTGSRVFLRRFIPKDAFDATKFLYAAELGGIDVGQDASLSIEYRFPDLTKPFGEVNK